MNASKETPPVPGLSPEDQKRLSAIENRTQILSDNIRELQRNAKIMVSGDAVFCPIESLDEMSWPEPLRKFKNMPSRAASHDRLYVKIDSSIFSDDGFDAGLYIQRESETKEQIWHIRIDIPATEYSWGPNVFFYTLHNEDLQLPAFVEGQREFFQIFDNDTLSDKERNLALAEGIFAIANTVFGEAFPVTRPEKD